jgi:hypothetical protein
MECKDDAVCASGRRGRSVIAGDELSERGGELICECGAFGSGGKANVSVESKRRDRLPHELGSREQVADVMHEPSAESKKPSG